MLSIIFASTLNLLKSKIDSIKTCIQQYFLTTIRKIILLTINTSFFIQKSRISLICSNNTCKINTTF